MLVADTLQRPENVKCFGFFRILVYVPKSYAGLNWSYAVLGNGALKDGLCQRRNKKYKKAIAPLSIIPRSPLQPLSNTE